jgi:hypothetical protein
VRIPSVALPAVGAVVGAAAGGGFGAVVGGVWALTGAPGEKAFALALWVLLSGAGAGAILGLCRALDRWLTDPPGGSEGYPEVPGRVPRFFVEANGNAAWPAEGRLTRQQPESGAPEPSPGPSPPDRAPQRRGLPPA